MASLRGLSVLSAVVLSLASAAPVAAQVEAVPFLDGDGAQLGTITIRELADPFTEFEPTRPPAEGQRYVVLTMIFEAAEDQAFPTDPRQIQLQDAAGYVYSPAGVPRPAESVMSDLQPQTLNPFDRVSGVVGYVLPEAAEVVRILYRGDGSRVIPIAQPGSSGAVAVAESQTFTDAGGTALGTITVRDVADPYTDFEPNRPPAEGQRYIVLDIAFEAAADQAMTADPRVVLLVDTNGVVYRPGQVSRPPGELLQGLDLQSLSPLDRVSGAIGFVVPTDVEIASIIYATESTRLVPLVDL